MNIQTNDILVMENGIEVIIDKVEPVDRPYSIDAYIEGWANNKPVYGYVEGDVIDSAWSLKGRIVKCLRP